jgi:hypothetical protein
VRVRLVRVHHDDIAARFKVSGTGYRVLPGGTFADGWTLLSLRDGTCATVRHGSTYADLCEGETYVLAQD